MDPAGNSYDPATNGMTIGAIDACPASEAADAGTHVHTAHFVVQNVEDLVGWQARLNYDGDRMRPLSVNLSPFTDTTTGQGVSFVTLPKDAATQAHRDIVGATNIPPQAPGPQTAFAGAVYNGAQGFVISPDTPAKSPPDDTSYSAPNGAVLAAVNLQVVGDQSGQTLFMQVDDGNPNPSESSVLVFNGAGVTMISISAAQLGSGYHAEGAATCEAVPTPTDAPVTPRPIPGETPEPTPTQTPTSPGPTPHVGQAPGISLDMDPAGNTYDPATNIMTIGAIDACLASETAETGTHVHTAHLVVRDVEDLVGWQVRLNYDDRMTPSMINFAPFTDTTTGQGVSFVNLPKDAATRVHRDIVGATNIPPQAPGPQTALAGAVYNGAQGFAISPDTPAKSPPDDSSYSAPNGGVLAAVNLEVVGDQSGQTLFMQVDDGNPNLPESAVQIFDGTGLTAISIPAERLGSGYHAEGAASCAAMPTPTDASPTPPWTRGPTPQPTPMPTPTQYPTGPTPTPPPPGSGGFFNPQIAATYSDTSPGSHPDIGTTFSMGLGPDGRPSTDDDTGDYMFAGLVNFVSTAPQDSEIPDGAVLGALDATETIGALNNACVTRIDLRFTLVEGTTDIANTVEPLPFGQDNDLGVIAGDTRPFDGIAEITPPPAVTKYPSYLNAIFDPDWVDYGVDKVAGNADDTNGPAPPIRPRFRSVGVAPIPSGGNLWIIRQELVFEPGTKLPGLPPFDAAYGYPTVTVLQQSSGNRSAAPPGPSAVTDRCTPFRETAVSYGITRDNQDTPENEGGAIVRTLPEASGLDACQRQPPGSGCIVGFAYSLSHRDADGDGIENPLDTCPFHADTVWNPRKHPRDGDSDIFIGVQAPDGIPDTCDTTPDEPTGWQPRDHDGDGFPNSGDNCPLHYNPDQSDRDKDANGEIVGDGIGDACDTPGTDGGTDCVGVDCTPGTGRPIPARSVAGNGPDVPDGEPLICVRVLTLTVGGPNEAEVSDCVTSTPPCSCPSPIIEVPSVPAGEPSADPTATPTAEPAAPDPTPPSAAAAAASSPTPAVAAAVSLPRTGDPSGRGSLPRSLALLVGAGLAIAAPAAAVRIWRTRRR